MRRSISILATMSLLLFVNGTAQSALTVQTNPAGEISIFDSYSNLNWFPDPGYFGGSLSIVNGRLQNINSNSYAGSNGWRLATASEVYSGLGSNSSADLEASFVSTHSNFGSQLVDPGFPFFGIPSVYASFTETHWYGIVAETGEATYTVTTTPPRPSYCGFFPTGPGCNPTPTTTTVTAPTHQAIDFTFVDFEPNPDPQRFLPEGACNFGLPFVHCWPDDSRYVDFTESLDSGYTPYGYDYSPLYGAWVVTAAVPEPEIYAMMAAGLGLMGFVGRRRKLKIAAT